MKFKKIKMKDIENIQELQVDYSSINQDKQMIYEPTRYTTINQHIEIMPQILLHIIYEKIG